MGMFQIVIAGGRDFNDYPLLERTVDQFLADVHDEITIFCGTARGADSLGERYAKKRGYAVRYFPPDWRRYGRAAGPKRNKEKAEAADAQAAIRDGESPGTDHNIRSPPPRGLRHMVTRY